MSREEQGRFHGAIGKKDKVKGCAAFQEIHFIIDDIQLCEGPGGENGKRRSKLRLMVSPYVNCAFMTLLPEPRRTSTL